jgi:hypothetical protein
MIVIYYMNWNGTIKELNEWEEQQKKHWAKVEGVKLLGIYTPSIPWNRAWLMETDSVDKLLANSGQRTDKIRNTDMVILM